MHTNLEKIADFFRQRENNTGNKFEFKKIIKSTDKTKYWRLILDLLFNFVDFSKRKLTY